MRKKVIPKAIRGIKIYKYIPFDKKREIAGYLKNGTIFYEKGEVLSSWTLPKDKCDFEFHTHPSNYTVIPSVADLIKNLLSSNKITIIIAWKELVVFKRTVRTEWVRKGLTIEGRKLLEACADRQFRRDEQSTLRLQKALIEWLDELCKKKLIKRSKRLIFEWLVDWEYIYRDLLHFKVQHYKR